MEKVKEVVIYRILFECLEDKKKNCVGTFKYVNEGDSLAKTCTVRFSGFLGYNPFPFFEATTTMYAMYKYMADNGYTHRILNTYTTVYVKS